jgi:hypothetical protein
MIKGTLWNQLQLGTWMWFFIFPLMRIYNKGEAMSFTLCSKYVHELLPYRYLHMRQSNRLESTFVESMRSMSVNRIQSYDFGRSNYNARLVVGYVVHFWKIFFSKRAMLLAALWVFTALIVGLASVFILWKRLWRCHAKIGTLVFTSGLWLSEAGS